MSHSYHTTRRHLREAREHDYADKSRRAASLERLRKEIETKRRVKRHVKAERQGPETPPHVPVELVPIRVRSRSPYVHFPASPEDMRGMLAALPAGIVDGLRGIELGLGLKAQEAPLEAMETAPEADPFVGRKGFEVLPGVYRGRTLARYVVAPRRIEVYGVVYDPAWPDRSLWEPYLCLQMLMSLVHEVAHHYDFMHRVARGRWRADDREKIEIYAEEVQHDWTGRYVIPYLEKARPAPLARLRQWMRESIGIEVPLELLAGEVRATARNGAIWVNAAFFNTASAFQELVGSLSKGEDPLRTRLQFARDVHYANEYDLAMQIVETVLRSLPRDTEAILLKAELLVHLERPAPALELAQDVLTREPECVDALEIMADAYELLKDWRRVIAWAEHLMDVCRKDASIHYGGALRRRALARMELGDYDGVRADIQELSSGGRREQGIARRLSKTLEERLKGGPAERGGPAKPGGAT
jgi:hypothetical protein